MIYGDFYSNLPDKILERISRPNRKLLRLSKYYFRYFGYPDLAGRGRFKRVLKMLDPKKQEKILDAGCGNGIYSNSLSYYFRCESVGVDIDRKRIDLAQDIADYLNLKAKFYKNDLEKLTFPDKTFAKIVCLEVIEHINEDRRLISNFQRLLKNKGDQIDLDLDRITLFCQAEEPADPLHMRIDHHT